METTAISHVYSASGSFRSSHERTCIKLQKFCSFLINPNATSNTYEMKKKNEKGKHKILGTFQSCTIFTVCGTVAFICVCSITRTDCYGTVVFICVCSITRTDC